MTKRTIENTCCCCGGIAKATYTEGDEEGKSFAEICDVCGECHIADCLVLTGTICNVTGKTQVRLLETQNET